MLTLWQQNNRAKQVGGFFQRPPVPSAVTRRHSANNHSQLRMWPVFFCFFFFLQQHFEVLLFNSSSPLSASYQTVKHNILAEQPQGGNAGKRQWGCQCGVCGKHTLCRRGQVTVLVKKTTHSLCHRMIGQQKCQHMPKITFHPDTRATPELVWRIGGCQMLTVKEREQPGRQETLRER